ncbi:hypothetical protein [Lapidilactobacillus wuchangensis]|uniref:hypothetical protein n=1 Tax=Lapidilactobacillus wuchangensis TaxID=2486001 RepID=UPI000F772C50|nr:hypothetical protein [Lapidilactobacillus wuchangensis]
MVFRGTNDLEQYRRIIRNWLLVSCLLLIGLCSYRPAQVTQAATVRIDKLVTIKTSNQTATQQTAPLAGVHYRLQAVMPTMPTNSQQQPTAADSKSYQPLTGSQAFAITLTTNQAGQVSYQNDSLPAGYYLLSEQASAIVPQPAAPVLLYFADHGQAGTANDVFDYVPKSGLTAAIEPHKSTMTSSKTSTAIANVNELRPNAKIMQSGGRVLPSWLIFVISGGFLLAIQSLIFKLKRQKNS